jgi:hypothetical protein
MDAADVLVQTLDKEVIAKREWVTSGQAKDYAEYQKICGEVKGLLFAKQEILDLKQKMEHSNE